MEIFLRELCRFQHSERRKAAGPPAALRPLRANFFAQFLSKPRARGEIRCTGIPQAWHLLKILCINANPSSQKADAELSTLATEILQYLSRNPSACDTLRGVAGWWILRQRIGTVTAHV